MPEKGRVILVGAGPGDPGLLTIAARDALAEADVVLYDRLVGDGILAMMPAAALKIDVGKNKGRHSVPQDEINRLLVRHALDGKTVVRLKGGDPYLFGRGAEEAEEAARENIPFRVVPGVTSAVAAPACAGIPVTHRGHSSSLHVFTGHGKDGTAPDIPYRELARLGGTLVFLMGLSTVDEICRGLSAAGMPPETPAALVENGTRSNQRRAVASLASLPDMAREKAFASPSILVVGRVCALAGVLDWTVRLPLGGKNILVVGSRSTGGRLASRLRANGGGVDEFAGIAMEPIPAPESFWRSVGGYRWIVLTSRFGAELFFDGLFERGIDIRSLAGARFAVVGPGTVEVLSRRGIHADCVPGRHDGPALGERLAELAEPGDRALLFRAESGGGDLPGILKDGDIGFDDHAAYRTTRNPLPPGIRGRVAAGVYDAIAFTSASAVEAFTDAAPERASLPPAFCIGEKTAAAARGHGMRAHVSPEAAIESLTDLITEVLQKSFSPAPQGV